MKTITVLTLAQKQQFDRIRRTKQAIKLLKAREQTAVENIKGEWAGEWEWLYNSRKVYSLSEQPQSKFDKKAFAEGLPGTIPAKYVQNVLDLMENFTTVETIRVFRCH